MEIVTGQALCSTKVGSWSIRSTSTVGNSTALEAAKVVSTVWPVVDPLVKTWSTTRECGSALAFFTVSSFQGSGARRPTIYIAPSAVNAFFRLFWSGSSSIHGHKKALRFRSARQTRVSMPDLALPISDCLLRGHFTSQGRAPFQEEAAQARIPSTDWPCKAVSRPSHGCLYPG